MVGEGALSQFSVRDKQTGQQINRYTYTRREGVYMMYNYDVLNQLNLFPSQTYSASKQSFGQTYFSIGHVKMLNPAF
jgi:hypothetical protein